MRGRRGQAALEYVLAVLALLAVVSAMGYVVAAAHHQSVRTEGLVRADYP